MRIALASYASRKVVPLGLLYIAASLRQAGHEVLWREATTAEEITNKLRSARVDAVGMSATTGMHLVYLQWAEQLKRDLGVSTILGGAHPTFVPQVIEEAAIDAVCIGEGEQSVVELADRLERGLDEQPIAGIHFKLPDGRIIHGPMRSPPADLDVLPRPAVELIYDHYRARGGYGVKPFMGSRGCLYRCSYCSNSAYLSLYGRSAAKLRLRDPQQIVDEIQEVKRRWGLTLVWLADASLLTDRAWAEELTGRIHRDVGRPFFCKVRPDHIDARSAEMLARAGCASVGLGIESGDERIRTKVLRRKLKRETIVQACRQLKAANIRVLAFNMVGIPTESLDDALRSVDLNIDCDVDFSEAMLLQPYPGNPLTDWAIEQGHFNGDFDTVDYSYLSTSPFEYSDERDRSAIERLQRLFGLAVEFPEVRRLLPWLVRVPADRFYDALFSLWYHWGFGSRIHQVR